MAGVPPWLIGFFRKRWLAALWCLFLTVVPVVLYRMGVADWVVFGCIGGLIASYWIFHKKAQITGRAYLGIVIVGLLLNIITDRIAMRSQRTLPPPVVKLPEYEILLLGEKSLPQWTAFISGFQVGLAKKGFLARTKSDPPDLIGRLRFDLPEGHTYIKISQVGLSEDPDGAERRGKLEGQVSEIVHSDSNCMMVIGFVTSTDAEEGLDMLDGVATADWPAIILPMATASTLVSRHNPLKDRPILRIVPSNAIEANLIAAKILEASPGNDHITVAIFRDSSNTEYSADLGEELRKNVESQNEAVIFDGTVDPNGTGEYVSDSFALLRPDYIIYVGMLKTGIPLVRQIVAVRNQENMLNRPPWNPVIILSDGCVDTAIEGYAQRDVFNGIWGCFPHGQPGQPLGTVDDKVGGEIRSPSFAMFGYDAALFAADTFPAATLQQGRLTRQSVGDALIRIRENWTDGVVVDDVLAGDYQFDDSGDIDPSGPTYHLWLFVGNKWICTERAIKAP